MTQRVFVAILTVLVFLAGFGARIWTEPRQAVPPAPSALRQEFPRVTKPGTEKKNEQQLDRAKLVAEIQKLRPQIEAFSSQMEEITAEFEREFALLLTPEQRGKFSAYKKKNAERDAKRLTEVTPLTDEDILRAKDRPLTWIYWQVTVTPMLEMLTKDYKLDANQQAALRAALALRRNRFLALFDSTPHPNVRLSRLAPLLERVTAPAK